MGEGIALVRDMFIADSMDEAREKAGEAMVRYISKSEVVHKDDMVEI